MRQRKRARWATALEIMAVAAALAGCGGPTYEVAEVDGVVTIDGKPGHKLRVEFVPDVDAGTSGPTSSGDTDGQGRFRLVMRESPASEIRPGAVVGQHRVVFTDLQLAASATGQGVPIRMQSEYSLAGTTPLTKQVTAGAQSIDIQFDSRGAALP